MSGVDCCDEVDFSVKPDLDNFELRDDTCYFSDANCLGHCVIQVNEFPQPQRCQNELVGTSDVWYEDEGFWSGDDEMDIEEFDDVGCVGQVGCSGACVDDNRCLPLPPRGGITDRVEDWTDDEGFWDDGDQGRDDNCTFFGDDHVDKCSLCMPVYDARQSVYEYIDVHNKVVESGRYNFECCRIPVLSGLHIPKWRTLLQHYDSPEIVDYLEFGWPLGVTGTVNHPDCDKNHKGARDFPQQVQDYLVSQVGKGCVLGPFAKSPFHDSVISPINTVPKKDGDRRFVLDLSWPSGSSVNDLIPVDSYLGVPGRLHLPSVDNLVDIVRQCGKGCLLYKRDLKQAFRQIPLDPGDIHLLGYKHRDHIYFDTVLSMGSRSSCQACQKVTNAVTFIAGSTGASVVNYIDDIAGGAPPDKAGRDFEELGSLLVDLGLQESHAKACPPSTNMSFLGIQFDTVESTLSIPSPKLQEIMSELDKWSCRSRATKTQVQSIIGSLNFMAACVRPGRVFLARMLNFLRGMPNKGSIRLSPEFCQDILWWRRFAPHFNGVSLMPLYDWSLPDAEFACDACLVGCGGVYQGHYFHASFPDFIAGQRLHINALELLTIVVALKLWGRLLVAKRIKLYCDNYASVLTLNTGRSRDPFMQACLREICLLASIHEFEIRAVHLPGVTNRIPDFLSRWDLSPAMQEKFRVATAHLSMVESFVPLQYFQFDHKW